MSDIIIYTKPGCPYCAAAKKDMNERGVAYKEIDVYSVPGAKEELLKLTRGVRIVPVIVEGDRVTIGPGG